MGRALVLAAAIAVPVLWLGAALLESQWLAVDRVVVRGNTRLSSGDVSALVEDIRGQNILRIDLNDYRRRVLGSAWVRDVTFWRVLPSTIELRVTEREPTALARIGRELHLVDATGVVIDAYGPRYPQFDLPIVDGLISREDGRLVADPERLEVIVRALGAFRGAPGLEPRLSQLDISDPYDLRVLVDGDSAWLRLGNEAFAERLLAYLEVSSQMQDRFRDADQVDLRFEGRMTLTAGGGPARPSE